MGKKNSKEVWITPKEVCEMTGIDHRNLSQIRFKDCRRDDPIGPYFETFNNRPKYLKSSVIAFMERRDERDAQLSGGRKS